MNQFKRKPLALLVAQLVGAASLIAASPAVFAQATTGTNLEADVPTPQKLERITVTGSAIKRTQTEGSLPVLTLDRAAIEQTGFTTATELIQSLPQVQNFVANSASVNGGGGGTATASLHALPSKYTLVLVDGERLAPTALSNSFGGGFGVQHQQHPPRRRGTRGNPAGRRLRRLRIRRDRRRGQLHSQEELDRRPGLGPGELAGASRRRQLECRHQQGLRRSRQGRLELHRDVQLQPPGRAHGAAARFLRDGRLFPVLA